MRYAKLSIGVMQCDKHCPHFTKVEAADKKELLICTKGNFVIDEYETSGIRDSIWPDLCPLEESP